MRTLCGTILAAAVAAGAVRADVPKTVNGKVELVKAEEVHARKGVGNFIAKLKAGKPVTVAYLGGSITEMSGWRNMTTDWLRKVNPKAEVTEVHAAIGGTGSGLGVFRLRHDALSETPDLLFVEFATNDSREPAESIWRNFDGESSANLRPTAHVREDRSSFRHACLERGGNAGRRGAADPQRAFLDDTVFDGACKSLS